MTIPFLVAFGLVLGFYDIVGRIVRPFSLSGFEWVMGALQWTLVWVFQLFGTRLEVERSALVRPHTGYIVISNHQSLFDIALIGGVMFSNLPKYVAKAELGRWIPSVSLNLKQGGHALIDRGDAASAIDEIKRLGERVQGRRPGTAGGRPRPGGRAGGDQRVVAAQQDVALPTRSPGEGPHRRADGPR